MSMTIFSKTPPLSHQHAPARVYPDDRQIHMREVHECLCVVTIDHFEPYIGCEDIGRGGK